MFGAHARTAPPMELSAADPKYKTQTTRTLDYSSSTQATSLECPSSDRPREQGLQLGITCLLALRVAADRVWEVVRTRFGKKTATATPGRKTRESKGEPTEERCAVSRQTKQTKR